MLTLKQTSVRKVRISRESRDIDFKRLNNFHISVKRDQMKERREPRVFSEDARQYFYVWYGM